MIILRQCIGLTKIMTSNELVEGVNEFSKKYSNVDTIRLKLLMPGMGLDASKQNWVNNNTFNKQDAQSLIEELDRNFEKVSSSIYYNEFNTKIVFDVSGDYSKDIVWNNNVFKDYKENDLDLILIKKLYGGDYTQTMDFKNKVYNQIKLHSKEADHVNSLTG